MKNAKREPEGVSLITTERNEKDAIEEFIKSALSQSRPPDEIIIADADSNDGTQEIIQSYIDNGAPIKIVLTPGNRSVGRNAAVKKAQYPIIACTDVGCRLDFNWLENLTKPFSDSSIHTVSGWFEADPKTKFEEISAALMIQNTKEIDINKWLPSSRSIAFSKTAWGKSGGYPEYREFGNSLIALKCGGEDTIFDQRLIKSGYKFANGLKAVVYWRPRKNILEFYKQYHMYALGDGIRIVDLKRFVILALDYSISTLSLLSLMLLPVPVLILLSMFALTYKIFRTLRRVYGPWKKFRSFYSLLLMMALIITYDVAQLFGYWTGVLHRLSIPKKQRRIE